MAYRIPLITQRLLVVMQKSSLHLIPVKMYYAQRFSTLHSNFSIQRPVLRCPSTNPLIAFYVAV